MNWMCRLKNHMNFITKIIYMINPYRWKWFKIHFYHLSIRILSTLIAKLQIAIRLKSFHKWSISSRIEIINRTNNIIYSRKDLKHKIVESHVSLLQAKSCIKAFFSKCKYQIQKYFLDLHWQRVPPYKRNSFL